MGASRANNMSTQLDTKALREKAGEATPGPWAAEFDARGMPIGISHDPDTWVMNGHTNIRDVEYIAAANPKTIIALLDERDAMMKVMEAARELWEFMIGMPDESKGGVMMLLALRDGLGYALSRATKD